MTDVSAVPATTNHVVDDEEILAALFQPPAEIRGNAEWTARYEALVRSLRRDSSGLPLDMAQMMLIERIASTYMRVSWYQSEGGMTDNQLDKLNEMYLKYTTQFQRVLQASDEVLRQDLLQKMLVITTDAVKLISSDDDRKAVRRHFQEKFAALGY